MPEIVTSRQNARVKQLRAALAGRGAVAIAAIEGPNLLREAIASQRLRPELELTTVFLREDRLRQEWPQELASLTPAPEIVLLSADAFDSAAGTMHSQGIAALLRKPAQTYAPAKDDLLLVAAGMQDPGNLGTLVRSAEAFGAAAVVLAENCVDPWNGKALRASAGSIFRLPLPCWDQQLSRAMADCGIRTLAAVPNSGAASPAQQIDLRSGCAIFIGNEGAGLSAAMLAHCGERITLTMPGLTESLNAAVAGSVLLYEAARQRQQT